jgi:type II secretory pathway component PulF
MMQMTHSQKQGDRGSAVAGSLLAIFGGLLWLLPAAIIVLIVPKSVQVFEESSAELPASTAAIIWVAIAVSAWWPLVALVWLVVVVGLVVLCVRVRARWPVALAGVFAGLSLLSEGVLTVLIMWWGL